MSGEPTERRDGEPEGLDHALEEVFGGGTSESGSSVLDRLGAEGQSISRILLREEDSDPGQVIRPRPPGVPSPTIDRYQVLGEVARGGVGVVLKSRDVDLGRDVALKILREEHEGNPQVLQRFVEEAQIGGQLQHPGIVPVYELGLGEHDRPYFTMKLVKGRTLAALLADRSSPSDERRRFLQIFEAVCQTMAYAHARGVIHRDLKPANVMVGAFGEVLVVDWGMGKVLERGGVADERLAKREPVADLSVIQTVRSEGTGSQSVVGSVMGTPRYMPPEQATGNVDEMDARSDVFALGAILCEMLTGKPPYTGDEQEVFQQAIRGKVADAHERLDASGADDELVSLAKACLSPAPTARPRDAGALAKEVGAYLATLDEKALNAQLDAAAATVKAKEERRRRRLAVGLAASVVGLVILGAGGWAWRQSELRTRLDEVARTVDAAIGDVTRLRTEAATAAPDQAIGIWREALAVARQAHDVAQSSDGDEGTRGRAYALLADLEEEEARAQKRAAADERDRVMVTRLEGIRAQYAETWDFSAALADCGKAFREYLGVGLLEVPPEEGARLLGGSAILEELCLALDGWITLGGWTKETRGRLLAILQRVDPDPWRAQLRSSAGDAKALAQLAKEADLDGLPVPSLLSLAYHLNAVGETEWDRRVAVAAWRRAPGNFWACFAAGQAHGTKPSPDPVEAIRFYTAALAARPRSAMAHNNLGCSLGEKGLHDDAITEYREAIRLDPSLVLAHNNLGTQLSAKGLLDDAIAAYREAIRLDPRNILAYYNLGNSLEKQGLHDDAIAACREAIRRDPEHAPTHSVLGNALSSTGLSDQAIAAYREAIRLDPEFAPAHYNLGAVLFNKGLPDAAIAACREAIRLDPKCANAHSTLGLALCAKGLLDSAVASYREAIRVDPRYAPARLGLGQVLREKGLYDDAIASYKEAIRLDPEFVRAYLSLGVIYCDVLHDYDRAILEFRTALRLDPDFAMAHNNWGVALMGKGLPDEAIAEFREAIRLDSKCALAHRHLGGALVGAGSLVGAIAAYREAIRLQPDAASTHILLGNALKEMGLLDEAIAAYREAIQLKPDYALAHANLGLVLKAVGQAEGAIAAYREAIRLDPRKAEAHCNLGHVLRQLGRFEEAVESLRRGHEMGSRRPGWTYPSAKWIQEAEREKALAARLPAIRDGSEQPEDAADALVLAGIAHVKRWYGLSARLCDEALATDPALAEDMAAYHRYNAACAAALAGAGQGEDAASLDDADRARWRGQALAWLRADLEHWGDRDPSEAALVAKNLAHWKVDADLAGIRDEAALKDLSREEQEACRAFWKDVDALLERAKEAE